MPTPRRGINTKRPASICITPGCDHILLIDDAGGRRTKCSWCHLNRKRRSAGSPTRMASSRLKNSRRRAAVVDGSLSAKRESEIRSAATTCSVCAAELTDTRWLPNSKHLDHIVPINIGGTHVEENVRIVCARCNLSRPRDGSDVELQLAIWQVA